MGPVHCNVILTLCPLTSTLWQLAWKSWWPSPSKSCPCQILYMIVISYVQGISIFLGTYRLLGCLDLLTFSLENMTFNFNVCSGHYSDTMNGNCFIFSGHVNLLLDLYTTVLFLHFDLDNTISLKILYDSLLGNYKWQLPNIFRASQTIMGLAHCHFDLFWPLSLKLWPLDLIYFC